MFSRLKEAHAAQVKAVAAGTEDQQSRLATLDTKMKELQEELAAEKEVNNDMEKLLGEQKKQLAQREKQIKAGGFCHASEQISLLSFCCWLAARMLIGAAAASCPQGLCKALQELRAEMVATTEKKPPARAAPKKEELDVQNMISKQTRELKVGFPSSSSSLESENEMKSSLL